jgi:phage head maturation protease
VSLDRPTAGSVEERQAPAVSVDGRRLRGVIPYGVESRDLGGWREVIEPGSLNGANLDELVATVEHKGLPLGRYPGTMALEDRADGAHWSVEPPASRADVREAVERGDLRAGSWRMIVGRDEWRGDTRHIHEISELKDVAVTARPAYPSAAVELRSAPDTNTNGAQRQEEAVTMAEDTGAPVEERIENENEEQVENRSTEATEPTEETRSAPERRGGLQVEARNEGGATRGLAATFRERGFPGARATVAWDEFRSASFAGETPDLNPIRRQGVPLGQDVRYAFPAFQTEAVGAEVTAVDVLRQKARTLPEAEDVVRDIDAVTEKPEVDSELELAQVPLKQVAGVQTEVPNVILAQAAVGRMIEGDLRLAINEGLDSLVLDELAKAAKLEAAKDTPTLIAIRQGVTAVQGEGYDPETVILSPEDAEELDVLRVDPEGEDYVFGAAQLAPRRLFGVLNVRVAKGATVPVVLDAAAVGRLYASPISLATFEENSGQTNTSTVRLEGHAAFGVERIAAASQITIKTE